DHMWSPHKIRHALHGVPGLELQPRLQQSHFKVSYYIDPQQIPLEEVRAILNREEQSVYVQMAFGQYLDILPLRASKGLALRYVANLWQLPLERVLVAGGSGADEDMMRGNTLAVVVANRHHEELSQVGEGDNIYFAHRPYAAGIVEALDYYDFLGRQEEAG
ncbi:MAG: HAD family hydrolase, partial [Pseudomonas sp.]